jgi:DNA-binding NarL/FixJ family response regulator
MLNACLRLDAYIQGYISRLHLKVRITPVDPLLPDHSHASIMTASPRGLVRRSFGCRLPGWVCVLIDMIRVLVVNSIQLIGNVITAVLRGEPDMEVVGCVTTVEDALAQAPNSDIVLLSTRLPEGGAIRITQALAESGLPVKVLMLGLAESEAEILRYVEAGAAGYVLQDESVEDLLAKVRAAYQGLAHISPEIAAALMERVAELARLAGKPEGETSELDDLTQREREILTLIGQGLSNQEIAQKLVIEIGTVKNHVHSILRKLNVSSRHDAADFLS